MKKIIITFLFITTISHAVCAADIQAPKAIYEHMTTIEDQINKEHDSMDEVSAKAQVAKYADLAKELNTEFLDPTIKRIDILMQKRASLSKDSAEIKGIDDEVNRLNNDVSQFSKRNMKSLTNLYSVMEKYSINNSASVIEDIRLKSSIYSRVFADKSPDHKGKALSFDEANTKHVKDMSKFDKVLANWQSETDCKQIGKIQNLEKRDICLKKISDCPECVAKANRDIKCENMNVKGYEEEYNACLRISATLAKPSCEVVTEQYVICNGAKYILDLKNNDSLKRDTKKIEDYIDSGKPNSGSNAVSK